MPQQIQAGIKDAYNRNPGSNQLQQLLEKQGKKEAVAAGNENKSNVYIKRAIYEKMVNHCHKELPFEACGLLSGKNGNNENHWEMTNIARSPVSFEMDLYDIKKVFQQIEKNNEKLTGIYHSHPTAAPVPSPTDIANAHYPEAAYFIVSFAYGKPVVKCYYIKGAEVIPLTIKIY